MLGIDVVVDFRVNFILPVKLDEAFEGISPTSRKK
jgi:hypothetical protein